MGEFGLDGANQALGQIISTGISSAAGIYGTKWSARKAYQYNKKLIRMQQDWQERMSNTAHQREVADLRAAGLNPILSATGGSGASFGSASAPSMSVDNPAEVASENSARAAAQISQFIHDQLDKKRNKAEVNNLEADSFLKGNQAMTEGERFNTQVETGNLIKKQIEDYTNQIENRNRLVKSQVELNESTAKYNSKRSLGFSSAKSVNYSGGVGPLKGQYSTSESSTW